MNNRCERAFLACLVAASLLLCPAAYADGFDWGDDCSSGNDSFQQYIAQNNTVVVGTIPAGKRSVRIDLQSSTDVDVQLIDAQTGTEIIAWPNGLMNGPGLESTTYAGATYRYSGYNGQGGQQGYEFIEVVGETNRNVVMRAFGYAAGQALVTYSWQAPEDCSQSGNGTFTQAIAANAIALVGHIPAGKPNVFVELEASGGRDIDVQLYHGNTRLVVWDTNGNHGLLSGAGQESTPYAGMTITYSGYNGHSGNPGLEYIRIAGDTTVPLTVKVFGYQSGTAKVDYAWGSGNATVPTTSRPIPPPTFVSANSRVVAIGDVHGDYQAARRVLQLVGAMNAQNQWVGGNLIVVQVGDQLDRGNGERAILDLFEVLADQAHAAGGGFYALNGNHEVMNVEEDFRYVTSGGWSEFSNISVPLTSKIASYPTYQRGRVGAFLPGGPYARILGEHNTTIVVGDTIFVHGGIHMSHVNYGLENLNASVQQWMKGYSAKPSILSGDTSPIWSRRYSSNTTASGCTELESVLDAVGVSRMVVAHTVQPDGINSACNGQVWRVDVGMSAHYGGSAAGLEILGNYVTPIEMN